MLKVVENLKIQDTLLKCIDKKEPAEKGRDTVSAKEVFHLLDMRRNIANQHLDALKYAFKEEIDVVDAYIELSYDDELLIVIEYLENGHKNKLTISQYFDEQLEDNPSLFLRKTMHLMDANKNLIMDTFNWLFHYRIGNSLVIPTTSNLFRIENAFDVKNWLMFKKNGFLLVVVVRI